MSAEIWYYTLATLLLVVNLAAWGSTLFTLPGNWFVVAASALFAWLVHKPDGGSITWLVVGILLVLAVLGELVEFAAGAAGAARHGGSRRGMLLAILGAMFGSIAGTAVGVPVPIAGPIIGALAGGAVGAFGGAYLGELWKGRSEEERLAIGGAALVGRLLGTVGKLAIGMIMVVLATADAFVN